MIIGLQQYALVLSMAGGERYGREARLPYGTVVAFVLPGQTCEGGGLASGESVDGTYSPRSTISDVAPVMLYGTPRQAGNVFLGNVLLGWIYTTPSGRFFQLNGSLATDASNGVVWGDVGGPPPIVPFFGDLAKALRLTLQFRGLAGDRLPVPLDSVENGTAHYSFHSCYH